MPRVEERAKGPIEGESGCVGPMEAPMQPQFCPYSEARKEGSRGHWVGTADRQTNRRALGKECPPPSPQMHTLREGGERGRDYG